MDSPLEEITEISAAKEETAWEMWLMWDSGEAFNEIKFTNLDTGSWVVIVIDDPRRLFF